jgi:iron complex outermembrane receptor protein
MYRLHRPVLLASASLWVLQAAPCAAQSAESGDKLEEIVVTAQKRSESIQDVPVAVSAFNDTQLVEFGIRSFDQLTKISPSFTYSESSSRTFSSLYMRGVGTYTLGVGVEPSVSVVLDGVPVVQSAQALSDLNDVEQIEVLRGPQGTLFGKNASAGVINIATKGPTDTFQASIEQTATTDEEYYTKAAVSGPITETVSFRLSGYYRNFAGTATDTLRDIMYNGEHAEGVIGKLRWKVTDDLNANFLLDYTNSNSNGTAGAILSFAGPAALEAELFPGITPGPRNTHLQTNLAEPPQASNDQDLRTGVTLDYDINGFILTSLSSYDRWKDLDASEDDYTGFNIAGYFGFPPPAGGIFQTERNQVQQVVQETRITSPKSDTVEYLGGVFYERAEYEREFDRLRIANSIWNSDLTTNTVGVYGNFKWGLTGSTFLDGGLRFNSQTYDVVYNNIAPTSSLAANTTLLGNNSDRALQGKVSLQQYLLDHDLMLFASYARGHKGLGYNITSDIDESQIAHPAKPEVSDSYELGAKGRFFDGRLQLDGTLFYAVYHDFQSQSQVADLATNVNTLILSNVGALQTKGIEVEGTVLVVNGFQVTANMAYTDAVIKNFLDATCYTLQTAAEGCIGGVQNLSGHGASNAPRWKGNLSGNYTRPIGRVDGFANFAYSYQSSQHYDLLGNPATYEPGYGILNLGAGIETGRYTINLFVNNLFDRAYENGIGDEGGIFGYHYATQFVARWKRYGGITAKVKF